MAFAYDIYTTTNINKVVLGGTLTNFEIDKIVPVGASVKTKLWRGGEE